jgi:hypothetical protein
MTDYACPYCGAGEHKKKDPCPSKAEYLEECDDEQEMFGDKFDHHELAASSCASDRDHQAKTTASEPQHGAEEPEGATRRDKSTERHSGALLAQAGDRRSCPELTTARPSISKRQQTNAGHAKALGKCIDKAITKYFEKLGRKGREFPSAETLCEGVLEKALELVEETYEGPGMAWAMILPRLAAFNSEAANDELLELADLDGDEDEDWNGYDEEDDDDDDDGPPPSKKKRPKKRKKEKWPKTKRAKKGAKPLVVAVSGAGGAAPVVIEPGTVLTDEQIHERVEAKLAALTPAAFTPATEQVLAADGPAIPGAPPYWEGGEKPKPGEPAPF